MLKNIIANLIGRFWSILSNFLFIPLYIHFLGFESYSIISFSLVLAGLLAVLDVGLTDTLSREFARADTQQEMKIRIFTTLESIYLIIVSASIALVLGLSGPIANHWLKVTTFSPAQLTYFLKIISVDMSLQLLLKFYVGGLLGFERQVKANLYLVGFGLVRNGFVIGIIYFISRLDLFFIWQSASTALFVVLLRFSLCKTLTGNRLYFAHRIDTAVLKQVWRFAFGMLLISVVAGINTQLDKLAISKLLPIESLGCYTLSVSLAMGLVTLVNPFSVALLPRFTTLFSTGKQAEASRLYSRTNMLVALLVFSVMASMICFSKELIWIWTGRADLSEKAHAVLPIVALSYAMLAMAMIPFNIAIANGYTKLNNVLGLLSLLITLPGYWFTTRSFGAVGVASVFCVVQTMTTLIYLYFINRKFIHIEGNYLLFIKPFVLPPLICLPIAFAFSIAPATLWQSRIYGLAWIALATFSSFLFSAFLLLSRADLPHLPQFIPRRG